MYIRDYDITGKCLIRGVPLLEPDGDSPLPMMKVLEFAHICIDFMYELHDFFWEEFNQTKVFGAHINAFWSFFLVDVREAIAQSDDTLLKLQLFHVVNHYFSSQRELLLGHCVLLTPFTVAQMPHVSKE